MLVSALPTYQVGFLPSIGEKKPPGPLVRSFHTQKTELRIAPRKNAPPAIISVVGGWLETSTPNAPHLHTNDLELVPFLAQGLVAKGHAGAADPAFQDGVEPEPVPPVAAADAEEARFAEDQVVVDATVGEGLEAE